MLGLIMSAAIAAVEPSTINLLYDVPVFQGSTVKVCVENTCESIEIPKPRNKSATTSGKGQEALNAVLAAIRSQYGANANIKITYKTVATPNGGSETEWSLDVSLAVGTSIGDQSGFAESQEKNHK